MKHFSGTAVPALDPSASQSLRSVSAKLGRDPALVQGGGGNTSIKLNGVLTVKASGHWLADAEQRDVFTRLDLHKARSIARAGGEDFSSALLDEDGQKPSIETAMHALMPQAAVVHAHPVALVAATLHRDARSRVADCLSDTPHAFIDYVQPGKALAEAVVSALDEHPVDALVLANHGLIVGGPDIATAAFQLRVLAGRFDTVGRDRITRPALPDISGYTPIVSFDAKRILERPDASEALCAGSFAPDQTVYLGGPAVRTKSAADAPSAIAGFLRERGVTPGLILLERTAIYRRSDLSGGARAVADFVLAVAARAPSEATTLRLEDDRALLGWDAEQHRQSVEAARDRGAA